MPLSYEPGRVRSRSTSTPRHGSACVHPIDTYAARRRRKAQMKLHFVYNVEATPQALIKDFVHRLTEPETYPCRLCDITYGRFVKKPGWQLFLWSLPVAT